MSCNKSLLHGTYSVPSPVLGPDKEFVPTPVLNKSQNRVGTSHINTVKNSRFFHKLQATDSHSKSTRNVQGIQINQIADPLLNDGFSNGLSRSSSVSKSPKREQRSLSAPKNIVERKLDDSVPATPSPKHLEYLEELIEVFLDVLFRMYRRATRSKQRRDTSKDHIVSTVKRTYNTMHAEKMYVSPLSEQKWNRNKCGNEIKPMLKVKYNAPGTWSFRPLCTEAAGSSLKNGEKHSSNHNPGTYLGSQATNIVVDPLINELVKNISKQDTVSLATDENLAGISKNTRSHSMLDTSKKSRQKANAKCVTINGVRTTEGTFNSENDPKTTSISYIPQKRTVEKVQNWKKQNDVHNKVMLSDLPQEINSKLIPDKETDTCSKIYKPGDEHPRDVSEVNLWIDADGGVPSPHETSKKETVCKRKGIIRKRKRTACLHTKEHQCEKKERSHRNVFPKRSRGIGNLIIRDGMKVANEEMQHIVNSPSYLIDDLTGWLSQTDELCSNMKSRVNRVLNSVGIEKNITMTEESRVPSHYEGTINADVQALKFTNRPAYIEISKVYTEDCEKSGELMSTEMSENDRDFQMVPAFRNDGLQVNDCHEKLSQVCPKKDGFQVNNVENCSIVSDVHGFGNHISQQNISKESDKQDKYNLESYQENMDTVKCTRANDWRENCTEHVFTSTFPSSENLSHVKPEIERLNVLRSEPSNSDDHCSDTPQKQCMNLLQDEHVEERTNNELLSEHILQNSQVQQCFCLPVDSVFRQNLPGCEDSDFSVTNQNSVAVNQVSLLEDELLTAKKLSLPQEKLTDDIQFTLLLDQRLSAEQLIDELRSCKSDTLLQEEMPNAIQLSLPQCELFSPASLFILPQQKLVSSVAGNTSKMATSVRISLEENPSKTSNLLPELSCLIPVASESQLPEMHDWKQLSGQLIQLSGQDAISVGDVIQDLRHQMHHPHSLENKSCLNSPRCHKRRNLSRCHGTGHTNKEESAKQLSTCSLKTWKSGTDLYETSTLKHHNRIFKNSILENVRGIYESVYLAQHKEGINLHAELVCPAHDLKETDSHIQCVEADNLQKITDAQVFNTETSLKEKCGLENTPCSNFNYEQNPKIKKQIPYDYTMTDEQNSKEDISYEGGEPTFPEKHAIYSPKCEEVVVQPDTRNLHFGNQEICSKCLQCEKPQRNQPNLELPCKFTNITNHHSETSTKAVINTKSTHLETCDILPWRFVESRKETIYLSPPMKFSSSEFPELPSDILSAPNITTVCKPTGKSINVAENCQFDARTDSCSGVDRTVCALKDNIHKRYEDVYEFAEYRRDISNIHLVRKQAHSEYFINPINQYRIDERNPCFDYWKTRQPNATNIQEIPLDLSRTGAMNVRASQGLCTPPLRDTPLNLLSESNTFQYNVSILPPVQESPLNLCTKSCR